jgi:hypothetical protein
MKKYKWVLFNLMFFFWLVNFAITSYALSDLIDPLGFVVLGFKITWSVILAICFCLFDLGMIAEMFLEPKSPKVASDSMYSPFFYFWMLGAFVNAILISWGFYLAYHLDLAYIVSIGLTYFAVRGTLFVVLPAYATLKS